MGKRVSSREIVLASQEAVEHIEHDLDEENEEDEDPKDRLEMNYPYASNVAQVLTLINLNATGKYLHVSTVCFKYLTGCISAIPRLVKRRKTARETLEPIVELFGRALAIAIPKSTPEQWDETMQAMAQVVMGTGKWVDDNTPDEGDAEVCFLWCTIVPSD